MSFKKIFPLLSTGVAVGLVVTACGGGGGADRPTSNTVYGQYVSTSSAGANLPKTALQAAFETTVACRGSSTDPQYAIFCQANNKDLDNNPVFGLFGKNKTTLNFVSSTMTSIQAVERDQLIYTTPGAPYLFAGGTVSNETVSGLVLLPLDASGNPLPAKDIKGVLIYYHPTVLSKAGVPSGYGNGTNSTNIASSSATQLMLAQIYANSGYVVVAPDYVGQGVNTAPVHPYVLLPVSNALSGIYMLPALKTYLANKGINVADINSGQPNLYISSYSEGGAYALWASNLIQNGYGNIVSNAGLTLKRTVGVSGAYDLTHKMLPFAFSNDSNGIGAESVANIYHVSPGCDPAFLGLSAAVCTDPAKQAGLRAVAQIGLASSKPVLGSYMVNALVTYDYTPIAYNLVMNPDFAQQKTCLNPSTLALGASAYSYISCSSLSGGQYSVYDLFNPNGLDAGVIANQLVMASAGSSVKNAYLIGSQPNFLSTFGALGMGQEFNSISSFIYPSLLNDQNIMTHIAAADIYNWTTNSPVSLVFMKYDSTVTNTNSQSACNTSASSLYSNSPSGMVTCVVDPTSGEQGINNTILWEGSATPQYLTHNSAEGILQLVALNQIESQ